jgi:hypothetical protein
MELSHKVGVSAFIKLLTYPFPKWLYPTPFPNPGKYSHYVSKLFSFFLKYKKLYLLYNYIVYYVHEYGVRVFKTMLSNANRGLRYNSVVEYLLSIHEVLDLNSIPSPSLPHKKINRDNLCIVDWKHYLHFPFFPSFSNLQYRILLQDHIHLILFKGKRSVNYLIKISSSSQKVRKCKQLIMNPVAQRGKKNLFVAV